MKICLLARTPLDPSAHAAIKRASSLLHVNISICSVDLMPDARPLSLPDAETPSTYSADHQILSLPNVPRSTSGMTRTPPIGLQSIVLLLCRTVHYCTLTVSQDRTACALRDHCHRLGKCRRCDGHGRSIGRCSGKQLRSAVRCL